MVTLLFFIALAHASSATADLAAIWSIEFRSAPANSLANHCSSDDSAVRERAALALGRLRDRDALPLLETLITDPDIQVRAVAAYSLGQTPESREAILRALEIENHSRVRTRLVAALGFHAVDADISLLVSLLEASPSIRREAAIDLGRLKLSGSESVDQPEIVSALSDALGGFEPSTRRAVAFALSRIQPTEMTDPTWNDLSHAAGNDRDPTVRARLTRALARSAGSRSQDFFTRAAQDSEVAVRVAAARAVRELQLGDSLEALTPMLQDESWAVRLAATEEIAKLESVPMEILRGLTSHADEPALVAAALTPLLLQDPDEHPRRWLGEDKPIQVRAAAVSALESNEQLLRIATEDTQAALRTAAATRLTDLSPEASTIRVLLGDRDAVIVSIALEYIGEHPEVLDLSGVLESLGQRAEADIALVLLPLLKALPNSERTPAKEVISNYRLHPELAVRRSAESLAADMNMAPAPPVAFNVAPPSMDMISRIRGARVLTEAGEIRLVLRPDLAPLAVHQFASLADGGFYDGLVFHRVVPDFVIQAGCPRGDGWGGSPHLLPAEPSWLPYEPGVLGMADAGHDTAGSQWFVTLSDQPHLEGRYTAFGSISLDNGVTKRIQQGTRILSVTIERTGSKAGLDTLPTGEQ